MVNSNTPYAISKVIFRIDIISQVVIFHLFFSNTTYAISKIIIIIDIINGKLSWLIQLAVQGILLVLTVGIQGLKRSIIC